MTETQSIAVGSRIPLALQSVFLASNRGKEVTVAPPEKVASKVYASKTAGSKGGRWFGLRRGNPNRLSEKSRKGLFGTCSASTSSGALSEVNGVNNHPSALQPIAPNTYLETILLSRGYHCQTVQAKECAYFNKSSALIEASYGTYMVEVVRSNRADLLHELLDCGLSPNAANSHGESIVHLACRLGLPGILQTLLEFGCRLQVADGTGRTPLHEACRAAEPVMEVIEMILDAEWEMLLVTDTRGFAPLAYVRPENRSMFTKFLMRKKETYWPNKLFMLRGQDPTSVPSLLTQKPNSQPILPPPSCITIHMARMVSSGRMSPSEADVLCKDDTEWADSDEESSTDADDDDDDEGTGTNLTDDFDDSDDDDDDSCISFDEGEMADVLASIGNAGPVSW